MMSQSGCSHEQNLKVILEAYNRALFHFPFDHFPLEAEYHIWGALKKSPVFVPAHAASAVLQSDELLFHFPATIRTDFVVSTHIILPAYKNRPNLIHALILLLSADK